MFHVMTMLWEPNAASYGFSRMYDESWVEKLFRGCKRHLTRPFEFVCLTDYERKFSEPIVQKQISSVRPDYSDFSEPYSYGVSMILVGLDTIIMDNIDHLAEYCLKRDLLALPRDPNRPDIACNGVALVPYGYTEVAQNYSGQNDMKWIRNFQHVFIDDIFPGEVVSYKGHVKKYGLDGAKIVYFHGNEKPHELDEEWIRQNWR